MTSNDKNEKIPIKLRWNNPELAFNFHLDSQMEKWIELGVCEGQTGYLLQFALAKRPTISNKEIAINMCSMQAQIYVVKTSWLNTFI